MSLIERWKSQKIQTNGVVLVGILLAFSLLLSEKAWGFNYLWFLPRPAILLLILGAGALTIHSFRISGKAIIKKKPGEQNSKIRPWVLVVLLPLVSLLITSFLPLATEAYGDSRSILSSYQEFFEASKGYVDSILALLDWKIFNLHNGERFSFNAVRLIKNITGFSLQGSFHALGVLCGMGAALIYGLYIRRLDQSKTLLPIVFFLSLNSLLVISGHIEVYGPSLFFLLLFLYFGRLHFEKNRWSTGLLLTLALFFSIKSHFIHFVLLAPYAYLMTLKVKESLFNYLTMRNVLVIFLSGFFGFLLAYFFVFQNHNSHYALESGLMENIFLPLLAPEAPYDHYSMLNINHLIDMFNLVVFWSPVFVIGLLLIFSQSTKHFYMRDNFFLIVVFGLITYLATAFVINPLLSFPRDWDLLSIGSPFLLIFGSELWFAQNTVFRAKVSPQLMAVFLLFVVPRTAVESDEHMSGKKLLNTGLHVFKTYYAGASVVLSKGTKQLNAREEEYMEGLINDLLDHTSVTPDYELCHFLTQAGYWYTDRFNDVEKSEHLFRTAMGLAPKYESAIKGLSINLQKKGKYDEALYLSQQLLDLKPDNREYLQFLINCYKGLGLRAELEQTVRHYIQLFPEEKQKVLKILD